MTGDTVEGQVDYVSRDEVIQALREMKTGKAPVPSDVSLELIAADGEIGIHLIVDMCQNSRYIGNASWAGLSFVVPMPVRWT